MQLYKSLCFTCTLCLSSCPLPSRRSAEQGCLGKRCAPLLMEQMWLLLELGPLLLEIQKENVSISYIKID